MAPNREDWLGCDLYGPGGHVLYHVTPCPIASADWLRHGHPTQRHQTDLGGGLAQKDGQSHCILFFFDPGTALGPGTKKHGEKEAVNGGGCEGELGHSSHIQTEVMREQRLKMAGNGSQETAEVLCDRQDHAGHKRGGKRSYVPGIVLEAEKETKVLFMQLMF